MTDNITGTAGDLATDHPNALLHEECALTTDRVSFIGLAIYVSTAHD
jgi:hypothetical protein